MTSTSKNNWVPIENSSTILAASYDKAKSLLMVEFSQRAIYSYVDVPVSVYNEFVSSENPGKYFKDNIKHLYTTRRIL